MPAGTSTSRRAVLRRQGKGFYTIGSAGHEGNAGVAAALRPTDPALLHYRSGAFYLVARGRRRRPGTACGTCCSAWSRRRTSRSRAAGTRCSASRRSNVIPQTSTIASHLPRAVGLAFALGRAARLGVRRALAGRRDRVCSFGDASVNHSTAAGALNTAAYCAYQRLPLPLLVVCEDNGIGISVRTPPGWVAAATSGRPGLRYFHADGSDLADVYDTALQAAAWVTAARAPAFLHLSMVRLGGHAGADAETAYRSAAEIAADLAPTR